MQLVIEPEFVERLVFEAARADAVLSRRYGREFAACGEEREPGRRERGFQALHARWLEELGLRSRIQELVGGFAQVRGRVDRLLIVDARTARRSGVELFGREGRWTVVVAVTPAMLVDAPAFARWAAFEFQHVDDMLDPAFGFEGSLPAEGGSPAAGSRLHERYALLWAISIDARRSAASADGAAICEAFEPRLREFARAFGLREPTAGQAEGDGLRTAFERLWARLRRERPRHAELLEWARSGVPGCGALAADPRAEGTARRPGETCPLCRFRTFDWADASALGEPARSAIRGDFPSWQTQDGLCGRCAELYQGRAAVLRRAC